MCVEECREHPEYILPHSDFGDPECSGLFFAIERGDRSDIQCNGCGVVLKSVRVAHLRRTLDMELDLASETCPHCGAVNLFPGFTSMNAHTCRQCRLRVVMGRPYQ